MSTPAFIRKNTPSLRQILEEKGYSPSRGVEGECIATAPNVMRYVTIREEQFDSSNPHITWNRAGRVDCGVDEEKFISLL